MNKLFRKLARVLKKLLGQGFYRKFDAFGHGVEAKLAAFLAGYPGKKLKVIGVTGTNGKTTTAVLLASILDAAGYRVGLATTALFKIGDKEWENDKNVTVTDPWSLQRLLKDMVKAEVEYAVLEVTSHALHQSRVAGINFHTAVMTNLTADHFDYHATADTAAYAATKAKLFQGAQHLIVLNHDDEWYEYFSQQGRANKLTYGTHATANVRLTKANLTNKGANVRFKVDGQELTAQLHLPGKFNVYNALAAATAAEGLGIEVDAIARGLEAVQAVPGRMEAIKNSKGLSVVVDYAHTPDAFEKVFEALRPVTKGQLIAVFGGAPMHDYKGLGRVAGERADRVIITDDEPKDVDPADIRTAIIEAATAGSAKVKEIADRSTAIKAAIKAAKPGDTIAVLALGHQKSRRIGESTIPWDDREVVRELLNEK